jgi:hypothetical protein
MNVLMLGNHLTERCGVAQYQRHMTQALRDIGVNALSWHSTAEEPLPENASEFDLIHVNWHAGTVGHLGSLSLPEVPTSIFIHEPAHPLPKIGVEANLIISTEEIECLNFKLLLPPCLDYSPQATWDGMELTIGNSGIRRDGLDWVQGAIARNDAELAQQYGVPEPGEFNPRAWRLCPSAEDADGWLSDEAEIERLAGCAMNVAHYHSGNSGQSYGVMLSLAANRPLLLNRNQMLKHLWQEELAESELYVIDDVTEGILQIVQDLRDGVERRPWRLREKRSWGKAAIQLGKWWGEIL